MRFSYSNSETGRSDDQRSTLNVQRSTPNGRRKSENTHLQTKDNAVCGMRAVFALVSTILMMVTGCDRMITPRNTQTVKDADKKAAEGDYMRAISMYESALDDSTQCADIHYKLALLYDDKVNDPLNALHHYKRYLTLEPAGSRAAEVKNFMKRDEVTLATTLSGDAIVTRTEAARLKNENLALRKQLEERTAKIRLAEKAAPAAPAEGPMKSGTRHYVVQEGDTLYSIARKVYKSPSRWKQIRDANKGKLAGGTKLEPGETLTIP
jgi:LysM repeat protein